MDNVWLSFPIDIYLQKKDAVLNGYLRNFNSEYFGMKFSHKIMEAFGLEYNKEYEVEVEEEK